MKNCTRLKNFPITLFAPILGLGGLTIVLQKMEAFYGLSKISIYVLIFTIIVLSVISIMYLLKIFFHWGEAKKERNHPVKINFFPAFPKGLLILSIAFLTISISTAKILRTIGAGMNLIFTIGIFLAYINKPFEIKHINPSRFIPVVTNIVIPITGMVVYPEYSEISRFFFTIGFVFWMLIFFIFMYRTIFHHPLPQKLLPTLVILIAPPAIGFISYTKLTGQELSSFGMILFYLSIFLFLLLLADVKKFFKIKFYLSRWAYSFPLAAFTLGNVLMYHLTENIFFKYFATIIAILLIIVIFILLYKTYISISKKELCVEEE